MFCNSKPLLIRASSLSSLGTNNKDYFNLFIIYMNLVTAEFVLKLKLFAWVVVSKILCFKQLTSINRANMGQSRFSEKEPPSAVLS